MTSTALINILKNNSVSVVMLGFIIIYFGEDLKKYIPIFLKAIFPTFASSIDKINKKVEKNVQTSVDKKIAEITPLPNIFIENVNIKGICVLFRGISFMHGLPTNEDELEKEIIQLVENQKNNLFMINLSELRHDAYITGSFINILKRIFIRLKTLQVKIKVIFPQNAPIQLEEFYQFLKQEHGSINVIKILE